MTDQKPMREIKFGSVRAAIWRNDQKDGQGSHVVSFRCCYKERGAWHESTTFGPGELPLLGRAAELALAWIYSQPRGRASQTIDEQ